MEIYEKVQFEEEFPIKVINILVDDYEEVKKHWHRSIEILVPIIGELSVWISGRTIRVKPEDIFIINTQEIHAICRESSKVYKGYVLQINYDYLEKCYANIDSIYFQQIKEEKVKNEALKCIQNIVTYYMLEEEHHLLKVKSELLTLVYILLNKQKHERIESKIIKSDKYRKRIVKVIEFIGEHYKENLTMEILVEHFHLSYGHLARLFKDHLKMTMKNYIILVRLKYATEDLINTDYSITEIAFNNGFPNVQSFYKAFKKEYEMTPVEYRKNIIK